MKQWQVPHHFHGINLLSFLRDQISSDLSTRAIKRAIESNYCRVNGQIERFASRTLCKHDSIELESFWGKDRRKTLPKVLYEDDELFVIDKPAKFVCEPKNIEKTFSQKLYLVHRLDKDTTGVLLLSKTKEVSELLIEEFAKRRVIKTYLAIVDGRIAQQRGVVENYLGKIGSYQGQSIWGKVRRGQYALSYYQRFSEKRNVSAVLVRPITGRTHQIRVHLNDLGYPILGDSQYCKKFSYPKVIERHLLHALQVEFHLRKIKYQFTAPIPQDMILISEEIQIALPNLSCASSD